MRRPDADRGAGSQQRLLGERDLDAITGLGVRRATIDWIGLQLDLGRDVALTLARIDRLDDVNASLGFDVGDAMLKSAAGRLRAVAPLGARTARLGNGVFLLACAGRARPDVSETARRLLVRMRERVHIGALSPPAAVSIGIAHSDGRSTVGRLLPDAHLALRTARSGGGDRMAIFDERERLDLLARLRIEQDLSWALAAERLEVTTSRSTT